MAGDFYSVSYELSCFQCVYFLSFNSQLSSLYEDSEKTTKQLKNEKESLIER